MNLPSYSSRYHATSRCPHPSLLRASWCLFVAILILVGAAVLPCAARTSNGNDFALYLVEAKTDGERDQLVADAQGRPHFFRYLQIMEMAEVDSDGRTSVRITAFEPASYMDVVFSVEKSVSLAKLKEEPVSKVGDALAVTGKVKAVDKDRNAILLDAVIVRHKDRLSPKMGKELLGEVDPGAVFYSFTRGPRPVQLTFRDRDLLQHRDRVLEEQGEQGWAAFLERELARRERERKGEAGR